MNKNSASILQQSSPLITAINWLFGAICLGIGILNIFWGNDAMFGIFIALLSLGYFLPANALLQKWFGFKMPMMGLVKILLALFILWAAVGVGELFAKIELMKASLA